MMKIFLRILTNSFVKSFITPYMKGRERRIDDYASGRNGSRLAKGLMTYTPQHVANFFLDKTREDNLPMSPLKLIKLVYIAYGWNIALTNDRLFHEPIQAWKHGPVIPSLYHEFKHFIKEPISGFSENIDLDNWETVTPRIPESDNVTNLILSKVWASYRRFRAWDLREKTHEEGSPWSKVYKTGQHSIRLRDEDITTHYIKRIGEYLDAAKEAN